MNGEESKFDTWTRDILLGIGADKNHVNLAHVGAMVRMIYDKGRAEGAEQMKAEILRESMPVVADFVHIPSVIVHVSVLAPKEKP